jgi:hypothetical protein
MDNDILINQARRLYAVLLVEQYTRYTGNKPQFERLDRLVMCAYCRYQRRLNRCVLCYQTRVADCDREILGKFCPHKHSNKPAVICAPQIFPVRAG